jgi:probable F420-dependent oxidoreductase
MHSMKLDGWVKGPLTDAGNAARQLEALGYDGAFTFEGPHGPFLPLLLAAEHTERIELMTNIAVAFARNPMDLAQIANDLQLASNGRFILGLGTQIRPHIEKRFSMPWGKPVARMRELVGAVRAIHHCWNEGARLDFRGEYYTHTLMTPFFEPGPNPYGAPPIFVAGLGPRMVELAAEVGDGLLIHPFNTERFVREHVAPSVDRGLARAGRARDAFSVAVTTIVLTGRDEQEMKNADAGVRRLLSFYGSTPAYRVTLDAHGWGDLQTELNTLSKQGRWDEMSGLIDDRIVDALAVCGEPASIGARVRERYGGFVDRVSFSMPYDPSAECIDEVLAGFRTAG